MGRKKGVGETHKVLGVPVSQMGRTTDEPFLVAHDRQALDGVHGTVTRIHIPLMPSVSLSAILPKYSFPSVMELTVGYPAWDEREMK